MKTSNILVYGAGGFAREVAWLIADIETVTNEGHCAGFIDDDPALQGQELNGLPVMSLQEAKKQWPGAAVVSGIGSPQTRQQVMANALVTGFSWTSLIHPRVEKSEFIEIGQGAVICAGNILTTNIRIGEQVQINLDCTIGHDCILGDYTTLAPGVHVSGYVTFGKRVYVGTGAVIINGTRANPLTIGDDVIIGAGACVTKSFPPGLTVVGVPAKPLTR